LEATQPQLFDLAVAKSSAFAFRRISPPVRREITNRSRLPQAQHEGLASSQLVAEKRLPEIPELKLKETAKFSALLPLQLI
jgi:hypothetical protein